MGGDSSKQAAPEVAAEKKQTAVASQSTKDASPKAKPAVQSIQTTVTAPAAAAPIIASLALSSPAKKTTPAAQAAVAVASAKVSPLKAPSSPTKKTSPEVQAAAAAFAEVPSSPAKKTSPEVQAAIAAAFAKAPSSPSKKTAPAAQAAAAVASATVSPPKAAEPPAAKSVPEANAKAEEKPEAKPESKPEGKGCGKGKRGSGYGPASSAIPPEVLERKVCVRNLPAGADSASVRAAFVAYFEVEEVDIKLRGDGQCRGYGFVTLATAGDAKKAIELLNGFWAGDHEVKVSMAKGKGEGKGADSQQTAHPGMRWQQKDVPKGAGKTGKGKNKSDGKAWRLKYPEQAVAVKGAGKTWRLKHWSEQYGYHEPHGQYDAWAMQRGASHNPSLMQYEAQAIYSGASWASGGVQDTDMMSGIDPSHEFSGALKSVSEKNGYGFVACEETFLLYGRDVYVSKHDLPSSAKVLDTLRFTIGYSDKGHPKAENVVVVPLRIALGGAAGY